MHTHARHTEIHTRRDELHLLVRLATRHCQTQLVTLSPLRCCTPTSFGSVQGARRFYVDSIDRTVSVHSLDKPLDCHPRGVTMDIRSAGEDGRVPEGNKPLIQFGAKRHSKRLVSWQEVLEFMERHDDSDVRTLDGGSW